MKHEKEGQLTLKQLDAQFLMENKIKKWFSSLFSWYILTSIYLFLVNKNIVKSFQYIINLQ